jgi:hypothetical protein
MLAVFLAAILYLSLIYICGRFTANYARSRGRSEITWFILGGLFYPLPYLVLALLRPKNPRGPHTKGDRPSLREQPQREHSNPQLRSAAPAIV